MINWFRNLFREPKVWFVSDLHFGHKNVISYCNRPYENIHEMHEALIKIWNSTVKKGDTVYVLGDFSLAPKWSQIVVPLLKGNKILISGNHDICFELPPKEVNEKTVRESREKYDRRRQRYLSDGWKSIHQTLQLKLKNGSTVLLSHLPYAPKEGEQFDKRYLSMRPKDEGLFLLHGHLHCKYRKYNNMIDVGIDGDLKLWSEDEIIELMNDKRTFIPSPITEYYSIRKDDRKQHE